MATVTIFRYIDAEIKKSQWIFKVEKGMDFHGICTFGDKTIKYREHRKVEDFLDTLIHEVIHASNPNIDEDATAVMACFLTRNIFTTIENHGFLITKIEKRLWKAIKCFKHLLAIDNDAYKAIKLSIISVLKAIKIEGIN